MSETATQFRFNTKERKAVLHRLAVEKKQTLGQAFAQWSGVFANDLIDYTPPRPKKGVKADWPAQKKAGVGALERDVRKIFQGPKELIKVLKLHSWVNHYPKLIGRLIQLVNAEDYASLVRVLDKLGMKLKLIQEPLREQHEAQRVKGVVKKANHRYYVLNDNRISGYVNIRKPQVGSLKSGWLSAATMAGIKPKDIPSWVRDKSKPGTGRANLTGPNYFVEFTNKARGSKDKDPMEIVAPAVAIIEKKMKKSLLAITHHWRSKYGSRPF